MVYFEKKRTARERGSFSMIEWLLFFPLWGLGAFLRVSSRNP
jgi:hypothetical protein